jgi:xanthine dehydrogenase accessory factor
MRHLLPDLDRLSADGTSVGRAVVTSIWGSAPQAEGAVMLATAAGIMAGSVSGGCVESATVEEIVAAMGRGTPRHVSYGVSDEAAAAVGLACGGTIKVLIEPRIRPELVALLRARLGGVLATVLAGPGAGGAVLFVDDGRVPMVLAADQTDETAKAVKAVKADELIGLIASIEPLAADALRREASRTVEISTASAAAQLFLEVIPRLPRLVIFGAVHIAAELVPLARRLGFETVVADGRQAFLTRERFPEADRLVLGWPDAAFAELGLDRATYVCLLSHDPKFDEPALRLALRSDAAYIGAIGSKKTQAARRERLLAEGFTAADLARLHGPIGLPLGGRRPAEIALAIAAEMVTVRYGANGASRG